MNSSGWTELAAEGLDTGPCIVIPAAPLPCSTTTLSSKASSECAALDLDNLCGRCMCIVGRRCRCTMLQWMELANHASPSVFPVNPPLLPCMTPAALYLQHPVWRRRHLWCLQEHRHQRDQRIRDGEGRAACGVLQALLADVAAGMCLQPIYYL